MLCSIDGRTEIVGTGDELIVGDSDGFVEGDDVGSGTTIAL